MLSLLVKYREKCDTLDMKSAERKKLFCFVFVNCLDWKGSLQ